METVIGEAAAIWVVTVTTVGIGAAAIFGIGEFLAIRAGAVAATVTCTVEIAVVDGATGADAGGELAVMVANTERDWLEQSR